jgi:hypothetical protein
MIKLPAPPYTFDQVVENCLENMVNKPRLKARLIAGKTELDDEIQKYLQKAQNGELHTLHPLPRVKNTDPVVVSDLKKSELMNLYEEYLRNKEKPGRVIYDKLLASANNNCPYCGGIGRPKNLDHYLPKAKFPQFSILPKNLVPSCRDCNMEGKGQAFSSLAGRQVIHPFFDEPHFFEEQWIFGSYNPDDEPFGSMTFFVKPPNHWPETDRLRVKNHFIDFDLGLRYSKEAGVRLVSLMPQINNLTDMGLELDEVKQALFNPSIAGLPHANHWERVMSLAIIEAI